MRLVRNYLNVCSENIKKLSSIEDKIYSAAEKILKAILSKNKILICGNGGSAADAQHFAAELLGRYKKERDAIAAIAMTVDTSAITAIANDYSYSDIFKRQLDGLGIENDILIGISTSGRSKNVVNALKLAQQKKIITISFTGQSHTEIIKYSDIAIQVPSKETNHIQEMHIIIIHIICEFIESKIC